MKKATTLLLLIFIFTSFSQKKSPLSIGETVTLESKILSEKRLLNIYLPDTYNQESIDYPVIYLLDGSTNEDFLHIAGLVQFFNLQFKMPKCIVVGIANVDRKRDFTHHTDLKDLKTKFPTTGKSNDFIHFIEQELQPYIEANYKVSDKKYLIGQSLGGLLGTEILLKKSYLFSNYIIVSPSLWWDNESMLNNAKELFSNQLDIPITVYIAVGKEGSTMEEEAKKLYELLLNSGKKQLTTTFKYFENENHATILHNSIYNAFLNEFPFKEK